MPARWVGVDFGTTNSAVAFVEGSGPPHLARFPSAGPRPTFPSVLYFEPRASGRRRPRGGTAAIERYLASESQGPLHPVAEGVPRRQHLRRAPAIGTQHYTLEKLIALIGKHMGEAARVRLVAGAAANHPWTAGALLQPARRRARRVCRPDVCWPRFASPASRRSCSSTSRSPPPTRTKRGCDRDERILIGDFGGGTSDFTIISVGPGVRAARPPCVRHHRHRRRADRRRRVRQAHHPQPRRAAARDGRRVSLAAEQVPAGAELACTSGSSAGTTCRS